MADTLATGAEIDPVPLRDPRDAVTAALKRNSHTHFCHYCAEMTWHSTALHDRLKGYGVDPKGDVKALRSKWLNRERQRRHRERG